MFALLGAWVAPAPPAARAQGMRYVDDDAGCGGRQPCYARIQAAVDAAAEGDLIQVAPGRYAEQVVVEDKGLAFVGPGIGDPAGPGRPDQHALWSGEVGGVRGPALVLDARGKDLVGARFQGFRVLSTTLGVVLLGRQPGDLLPLPPGRPPSGPTATAVVGAELRDNLFLGSRAAGALRGAVLAQWTRGLIVEGNQVRGGAAGLALWAPSGARVSRNQIAGTEGPGILVHAQGDDLRVADNVVTGVGGRGIELRDLGQPGLAGLAAGLSVTGNQVTDSVGEGIAVVVEGGGRLEAIHLADNRVNDAGARAPNGTAEFRGGIAVWARQGSLADLTVDGDVVRRTRQPQRTDGAGLYVGRVAGTMAITGLLASDGLGPGVQLVDLAAARLAGAVITRNGLGVALVQTPAGPAGLGRGSRAPRAGPASLVLGGAPEAGNRFGGNLGPALVLDNQTGARDPTADVDARYNDWGTPYGPDIEALVRHRPDDAALGRVSYLPALGVAETVALAAEPPRLVAAAGTRGRVSVDVADLAGLPVADGSLVTVATDLGRVEPAGGQVEAEAGAVRRGGEWDEQTGQAFGPYDGTGFLRSRDPGAQLSWSFQAPALALRYGQAVSTTGVFRVQVDRRDLGLFSTAGPERAWAWRLLARDLGEGSHALTVTLQSGELNVDALVAGSTTVAGGTAVSLWAGGALGTAQLTATAYGAAGARSGRLAVPFVAGPAAALSLGAERLRLPVGGETSRVWALATDAQGRPVPDGTAVRLTVSRGTVSPELALTDGGRAEATVTSDTELGPVTLRAESGSALASLTLEFVPGPPARVEVSASRSSLAANSVAYAELTARVWDAWQHPVQDGTLVRFSTTLGQLEQAEASTLNGQAEAGLQAGRLAGPALVRATTGEASGSVTVTLVAPDLRLTKTVEPRSALIPGELVTYTLAVANVGSGTVYGAVVSDVVPTDLLVPVRSTAQGLPALTDLGEPRFRWQLARLRPGEQGAITVTLQVSATHAWVGRTELLNTASLLSETAAERTPDDNVGQASVIVVPFAPFTVTLTAPERLMVGGTTGSVYARVVDREGRPAPDGTTVFFSTDLGTLKPEQAVTRAGVARVTFVTGLRSGVATVRAETREERGATAYVNVVPGPSQGLSLVGARSWLQVGGDSTVLTATLTDGWDNPVPGETIVFGSSLGSFRAEDGVHGTLRGVTGAGGLVTTTLMSGARTGDAQVSAQNGMLARRLVIPFRPGPPEHLSLRLSRDQVTVGDEVLVTGRVADVYDNPIAGVPLVFEALVGRLRSPAGLTDAAGELRTVLEADTPGFGMVSVSGAGRTAFTVLTIQAVNIFLPLVLRQAR